MSDKKKLVVGDDGQVTCPCGGETFTETRTELMPVEQSVTLARAEDGTFSADDYLDSWEWFDGDTLYVAYHECDECSAQYGQDGIEDSPGWHRPDLMADALREIARMRDVLANNPLVSGSAKINANQCFDDWAADLADAVVRQEYGNYPPAPSSMQSRIVDSEGEPLFRRLAGSEGE